MSIRIRPTCEVCGGPREIVNVEPFRRYEGWTIVHCPRCRPAANRRPRESVEAWARRIMRDAP